MQAKVPIVKDLVLLGGGHSHVEVLRSFGMRPMPGVRLTLITRDVHTPYSGMLPGYVSGFYTYDDVHLDLVKVAGWAQARLVHAEAIGLDIQKRRVLFRDRPPILYDTLSMDIGITPAAERVPGAKQHTVAVKPIDGFVSRLEQLLVRYRDSQGPMQLVVVGGGAGGVEIALSMQYRLEQERKAAGRPSSHTAHISLMCRDKLLGSHTAYARSAFVTILARKGVTLYEHCQVVKVESGALVYQAGRHPATGAPHSSSSSSSSSGLAAGQQAGSAGPRQQEGAVGIQGGQQTGDGSAGGQGASGAVDLQVLPFDECLWCTQASAAPWLKGTGLPTDANGFILINECLQSDSGPPEVFAAGDVATSSKHPRPKAGVFAVRQGPPLAANLRHFLAGEALQPFVPQTTFLSLITTGDKYCVATKGWLGLQGGYLWRWKDHIDRTFMRKYGDDLAHMMERMMDQADTHMPAGASTTPAVVVAAGPEALALFAESKMRCGGCGAKVGSSVLSRALARLPPSPVPAPNVVVGLSAPDDAAILRPPGPGKLLVQTVDFFRSFWDDPYVFGQVAANHALGDIWAMGGRPIGALAVAVVPLMSAQATEEELVAMLTGAHRVLSSAGCALLGGHTCEGPEVALGFSVTGEVAEGALLVKSGLQPGQALLLTKGLGCGTIMAAQMRGQVRGRYVMSALRSMVQSSQAAMEVLLVHGATAATDVTGFGLLGHLVEMTRPSQVHAVIDWAQVPFLEGAQECLAQGVLSSIHTQNAKSAAAVTNFEEVRQVQPVQWPILVDPQTGGGLLAGVPQDRAAACVEALHAAGYQQACIIGRTMEPKAGLSDITITLPK